MPLRVGMDVALLLLTGLFLFANFLSLGIQRDSVGRPDHWMPLVVWLACALAGQAWLARALPRRDALLYPLIMLPAGQGLLILDRLFPALADRQSLWLPAGLLVALGLATWPPLLTRSGSRGRLQPAIIATLLLAAILLEGENAVLPGELLKLALVVYFCAWLADRPSDAEQPRRVNAWRWQSLLWLLPLLILVWQRDPGAALIAGIVFFLLLNLAFASRKLLLASLLIALLAALPAWLLLEVVRQRVFIWLNLQANASGDGYQIIQGLIAIAEGGPDGVGVGRGQPHFVPLVHSDLVLAALAEEWGLIGVLVILAGMAVYALRGLAVAWRLREDGFRCLLATGAMLLPVVQGLVICAGVLGLFPLTGVTLPFLGYGGSSLLTSLLAASMLLRLSHESADRPA